LRSEPMSFTSLLLGVLPLVVVAVLAAPPEAEEDKEELETARSGDAVADALCGVGARATSAEAAEDAAVPPVLCCVAISSLELGSPQLESARRLLLLVAAPAVEPLAALEVLVIVLALSTRVKRATPPSVTCVHVPEACAAC